MNYRDLCIGSLNVMRTESIRHRLIKYANIIVERGLVQYKNTYKSKYTTTIIAPTFYMSSYFLYVMYVSNIFLET